MSNAIKSISIKGYKSIRKMDIDLRPLNVLIGANGAGKSNFVSFFRLLHEMVEQRLQLAVNSEGGADAILHFGPKVTKHLDAILRFASTVYQFSLTPTADNQLIFKSESVGQRTGGGIHCIQCCGGVGAAWQGFRPFSQHIARLVCRAANPTVHRRTG